MGVLEGSLLLIALVTLTAAGIHLFRKPANGIKHEDLCDISLDAMLLVDTQGYIRRANDAANK